MGKSTSQRVQLRAMSYQSKLNQRAKNIGIHINTDAPGVGRANRNDRILLPVSLDILNNRDSDYLLDLNPLG